MGLSRATNFVHVKHSTVPKKEKETRRLCLICVCRLCSAGSAVYTVPQLREILAVALPKAEPNSCERVGLPTERTQAGGRRPRDKVRACKAALNEAHPFLPRVLKGSVHSQPLYYIVSCPSVERPVLSPVRESGNVTELLQAPENSFVLTCKG